MSLSVSMDGFLEAATTREINWNESGKRWLESFRNHATALRDHEHRRSTALLCQFISNRYYPPTQGDPRTIQVSPGAYSSRFDRQRVGSGKRVSGRVDLGGSRIIKKK